MQKKSANRVTRWREFEDWVEFYPAGSFRHVGNGKYEALMNFGGPGAAVAYYFYARVQKGAETVVTGVAVEDREFEFDPRPAAVTGTPVGIQWVCLGLVKSRRDYCRATLTAPGGLDGLERVCVLEIRERLDSGEIERRIARESVGPEPLSGVPLGGVGAGKLELCRDGLFRNITINGNIDAPIYRSAASFFSVSAETAGCRSGRILAGEALHGLWPVETLKYEGIYPRAVLRACDRAFPVAVEIRATGPVLPRNVKDSSLPLALFRVRLTATASTPVNAVFAFCLENFLGCGGTVASLAERATFDEGYYFLWEERAGNTEKPWRRGPHAGILFDGGEKEEKRSEGQYVLAVDTGTVQALTGWRYEDAGRVWGEFADRGEFPAVNAGPSSGERTAAALAVPMELAPGESREFRFVLAWYVPHFRQSGEVDYGHYYTNSFASAEAVALYGLEQFDRIEQEAFAVPAQLLESSLPPWLAQSLCNDAYPFSTGTWLTRDGRFAVNEGPTHMFGCMGTLDQKLYANHYYSLFFPELDRTELLGFVRAQGDNGGIQHDLGYGHLEQKNRPHTWPDLSSSLAILSLKHYQLTGDQAYIDEAYPALVRALLDYQLGMDSDGDGIANISGVGNTFDAEKFEGTSSYIASVWLAALKALEDLAQHRGDAATAHRCREVFARARDNAIRELWNGRYFVNYYDAAKKQQCPNSHISQVAGEFFARLCGLGPLYGDHYIREAVASLFRLNFHPHFQCPVNEAAPDGTMPYRKLWGWLPHARIYVSGTAFYFDFHEEGLETLSRLERLVAEVNDNNRWDQRLFYEPDTGKQHWGRFYMTAPATWYVYQALTGYFWDQPKGILGLMPNLPASLLPFQGPLFVPGFWGWLNVAENRTDLTLQIRRRFDQGLRVRELRLPAVAGVRTVLADGKPVSCRRTEGGLAGREDRFACELDLDQVNELVFKG